MSQKLRGFVLLIMSLVYPSAVLSVLACTVAVAISESWDLTDLGYAVAIAVAAVIVSFMGIARTKEGGYLLTRNHPVTQHVVEQLKQNPRLLRGVELEHAVYGCVHSYLAMSGTNMDEHNRQKARGFAKEILPMVKSSLEEAKLQV